jgi:hypothetical protein
MDRSEARNLAVLFTLAYVYSLVFAPRIASHRGPTGILPKLNAAHESCVIDTGNITRRVRYLNGRGSEYYIDAMDESKARTLQFCLVTFWSFTHLVLYFLVGVFCPHYAGLAFIAGVLFEVYEYAYLRCHDILDIAWNAAGLGAGLYVSSKAAR